MAQQEVQTNIVHLESEDAFGPAVLQAPSLVLVDFWAPWCGPCRAQNPIVEQLARQNNERLRVVKVNVDEIEGLARRYDIRGIPTLIAFQDGKEKVRLVGLQTLEDLKEALSL